MVPNSYNIGSVGANKEPSQRASRNSQHGNAAAAVCLARGLTHSRLDSGECYCAFRTEDARWVILGYNRTQSVGRQLQTLEEYLDSRARAVSIVIPLHSGLGS